nr:hypothetical protein [Tanacetum cinerariifolium]
MAALVISILTYSSEESVGDSLWHYSSILVIPLVPAEVPIAPADPIVTLEVGAVSVISPIGVLHLVDYSSFSNSDPSEDSLPVAPELPLVSPFLYFDNSEVDSESEPAEQRLMRHESLAPSSEFPLTRVVAPTEIHRQPAILVRPGEAIPFYRPYRTHLNGLHNLSSDSSSDIFSGSLSDSSSVHSPGQSHSGPSTRVASPRLVDPPVRTPRCSEAFMRWRSAPLSSLYPPTKSESSLDLSFKRSLDSSLHSIRPSRKRCRPRTTLVPSSTHVSRLIAPTLVDLPPHKRFRDSYSSEVSGEKHVEMGTFDTETVADLGISEGVRAHTKDGIDLGVEVSTSDIMEDEEEFEAEAIAGGTMEIFVDPLATGLQSLRLLRDSWRLVSWWLAERAGLADRVRCLVQDNLRVRALLCIGRDRVDSLRHHMVLFQEEFHQVRKDSNDTQRRLRRLESLVERRLGFRQEVLATYEATYAANALEAETQSQNGSDNDKGNDGNRNGRNGNGGNRNGGNENGGNGNPNENDRGARPVYQECSYQDFIKCQPFNFKGTKGVVGLIRWFEKMEIIFHISNCPEKYQMESELWNLTVKNNDLAAYTQKFQELTMLCTKMVPEEKDQVKKFIGGLPDNILGNVNAVEPTRLQDDVRTANNLMDQKLKGYAVKNTKNKRKFDNSQKDNRGQQPLNKRQNVGGQNMTRAYTTGNNKSRVYNGLLPLYNKCKFHHEGPCTRGQVVNQRIVTCYECMRHGHYRNDCPKLKEKNRGNKTGNKNEIGEARGKAYVLGRGDANPDSDVVTVFENRPDTLYGKSCAHDVYLKSDTSYRELILCISCAKLALIHRIFIAGYDV